MSALCLTVSLLCSVSTMLLSVDIMADGVFTHSLSCVAIYTAYCVLREEFIRKIIPYSDLYIYASQRE